MRARLPLLSLFFSTLGLAKEQTEGVSYETSYSTSVVATLTTVLSSATAIVVNDKTYVASGFTTLTITDCPCTQTHTYTTKYVTICSAPVNYTADDLDYDGVAHASGASGSTGSSEGNAGAAGTTGGIVGASGHGVSAESGGFGASDSLNGVGDTGDNGGLGEASGASNSTRNGAAGIADVRGSIGSTGNNDGVPLATRAAQASLYPVPENSAIVYVSNSAVKHGISIILISVSVAALL